MTALALVISVVLMFISGWGLAYVYGVIKLNAERREWTEYLRGLTVELERIEETWEKSNKVLRKIVATACKKQGE